MLRYLESKGNTEEQYIVKYIETCMCENELGYWYCVITKYAGMNLEAMLIKSLDIDIPKLIQNLTTAVNHLHNDLLIYHRDIKCANVFYDENTDTFRLGDFDLSLFAHEDTDDTRGRGTPNYRLPIDTVIKHQHFGFVADRFATWVTLMYADGKDAKLEEYRKNNSKVRITGNTDIDRYWIEEVLPYVCTTRTEIVLESNESYTEMLEEETMTWWDVPPSRGVNTFRSSSYTPEEQPDIALRYPIELGHPVPLLGTWGLYVYENYIYMSAQRRHIDGRVLTPMTTQYGVKHTSNESRHETEVNIYKLLWTCPLPFLLQAVSHDGPRIRLEHCEFDLVDYIHNLKKKLKAFKPIFYRLTQHLSSAVECLHTMHILHMDIKMENIFVTDAQTTSPIFKLGDFDLSVLATQWTAEHKFSGSATSRLPRDVALNVPPESFSTGIAMDWFSVSVVLADAWNGRNHLRLHTAVNEYMECRKSSDEQKVDQCTKKLKYLMLRDGEFVNTIVEYCLTLTDDITLDARSFLENNEVQRIFRTRFLPYTQKAVDQSMQDGETIVDLLVELTDIPLLSRTNVRYSKDLERED